MRVCLPVLEVLLYLLVLEVLQDLLGFLVDLCTVLSVVFSPSSSQILLVTAMYSVRGTLEELTANFGPFCSKDCSPSVSGLLDKLMTHFFFMMLGTGVFL